MHKRNLLTLALFGCLLLAPHSNAGNLLECMDTSLKSMDTQQLADTLRAAGGEDCQLQTESWGDVLRCERSHARAYSLPVKEMGAEIHQSGLRTLLLVVQASMSQTTRQLEEHDTGAGLAREIQAREDGATTIRCLTSDSDKVRHGGSISGQTPPIPPGASGWRVCAQPATGEESCAPAQPDGTYRIEGLAPGEYGVIATPTNATDPLLRAMLVRSEPIGINDQGGPKVIAERLNVATDAEVSATELQLLRLPPDQ